MTNILNSLMSGGYEPDIESILFVQDIDCQYNVCWQEDGETHTTSFPVFEGEDNTAIFENACKFAMKHDTLVFYVEPCLTFFNPKTGEEVDEPTRFGTDYYSQPPTPKEQFRFVATESDELPF